MTLEPPLLNGEIRQDVHNGCRCRRPKQHVFFRFLWNNPGVSLKAAAKELRISYDNAKQIHHRLSIDSKLSRRCPECFRPSLQGLVCTNCGAELDTPRLPQGIKFEETSPVHTIQPLNGLGSVTPYQGGLDSQGSWKSMKMQYGGRNIQHLVEVSKNGLLERCKSQLWERLKGPMPEDGIVEEATKLLTREVLEFEARYPTLARSGNATKALVDNVIKLMALRYPSLRTSDKVTFHREQDNLGGEENE